MKDREAESFMENAGRQPEEEARPPGEDAPPVAGSMTLSSGEYGDLKRKAEERDLYLNELLRIKADFENFQKRMRRERSTWEEQAVRRLMRDFLPVVDNLERAIEHASSNASGAAGLEEGVRLTHQMLEQVLKNHGVEEIRAEGERFDPELHEAVSEVEVTDRPTGAVAAVLEKGYRHGNTVLRPSRVNVARNVEDAGRAAGATEKAAEDENDANL